MPTPPLLASSPAPADTTQYADLRLIRHPCPDVWCRLGAHAALGMARFDLVASDGSVVAGMTVGLAASHAVIGYVSVDAAHRGRGYGIAIHTLVARALGLPLLVEEMCSPDEQRVLASLQRRGWRIERHPTMTIVGSGIRQQAYPALVLTPPEQAAPSVPTLPQHVAPLFAARPLVPVRLASGVDLMRRAPVSPLALLAVLLAAVGGVQ